MGLSIHLKGTWDQPIHKLNWAHHIPISLESTRLSKNYTYLISATTQKSSTKIIHYQTCFQHTSLICTHMPTWTWVISTRRRHRLSTSCESNFLWIKATIKTWNHNPRKAEMSYLVMIYLWIFNTSRQPKVRTSPSHESTIRKIKTLAQYKGFLCF